MKHEPKLKPPPNHLDAANAVLTQWRMENSPLPPDNFLRGKYWEDEMPLPQDGPNRRGWILGIGAVIALTGAAIGAALSFVS